MLNQLSNIISRSYKFNKFSTNIPLNTNPIKNNILKNDSTSTIVEVRKSNIKQSPLRMKFLVMLIRDSWVPDALAQLKFSPKHKAVDIRKMVQVSRLLLIVHYY